MMTYMNTDTGAAEDAIWRIMHDRIYRGYSGLGTTREEPDVSDVRETIAAIKAEARAELLAHLPAEAREPLAAYLDMRFRVEDALVIEDGVGRALWDEAAANARALRASGVYKHLPALAAALRGTGARE